MKRFALGLTLAAAAVASTGGSAQAKGPNIPVSTRAVITGPGLGQPLVITGDVSAYGFDGFEAPHNELTELTGAVGLEGGPDIGWYELAPDLASLGPGYQIIYTFTGANSDRSIDLPLFGPGTKVDLTVPFRQVVYPFAGKRPLVYTPRGQFFLTRMVGEWWSAPHSLLTWLVARGMPPTPMERVGGLLRLQLGVSRL